jgi:hypothetical protein
MYSARLQQLALEDNIERSQDDRSGRCKVRFSVGACEIQ